MAGCPSGHKGADLKSAVVTSPVGSNPTPVAKGELNMEDMNVEEILQMIDDADFLDDLSKANFSHIVEKIAKEWNSMSQKEREKIVDLMLKG